MMYLIIFIAFSIQVHSKDIPYLSNSGEVEEKDAPLPIYDETKCKKNELYYPGKPDWFCDCAPGFLYYEAKDGCFPAYRKGPCASGQHLVIKKSSRMAECVTNPCQDGFVRFKEKCYELDKPDGPCKPIREGGGILHVNATTLLIECSETGLDPLFLFDIPKRCPPGTVKDRTDTCRENWNKDDDDDDDDDNH